MNKKEHGFKYNLIYAFTAQIISLVLSLLISFVLPKVLGVTDFSYWQLFVFYTNFVSCTQLGLVDGIYLRLGGKRYEELDFRALSVQFWLMLLWQLLLFAVLCAVSFAAVHDAARRFVLIMVGVYMIIYNLSSYIGFVFQAVNNTSVFSKKTLLDRILIIAMGVTLFLAGHMEWQTCILIYVSGVALSLVYTAAKGRQIVFCRFGRSDVKAARPYIKENIASGFHLMAANLASTLIIGIVRFTVDCKWGLEAFGIFSFSLSLTNFFLLFINQISMVLFPALRRIDQRAQVSYYTALRNGLSMVLPLIYVVYMPVKMLVGLWLPQYLESLSYLMYLLPICIFDGKMQLLCNTYLKVLRREKFLLGINLLTGIVSLIGAVIGAYALNSIFACIFFLLGAIVFRSVVTEIYLSGILQVRMMKNMLADFGMLAGFLFSFMFIKNPYIGELIILCLYGVHFACSLHAFPHLPKRKEKN